VGVRAATAEFLADESSSSERSKYISIWTPDERGEIYLTQKWTEMDSKEESDLASCCIKGGESHRRLRGALSSKRTLYGDTPPKQQQQDTTSSYTHAEKSEKHKELVRKHYDHDREDTEEAVDPQAKDLQENDSGPYTQPRKNLFEEDKIA